MSTAGMVGGGLILRSWRSELGHGRRRLWWCIRIIRRGTGRGRRNGKGWRKYVRGMGWRWLWMRCVWIIRWRRGGKWGGGVAGGGGMECDSAAAAGGLGSEGCGDVVAGSRGGGAPGVVLWDSRIGAGGGEFIGI